MIKIKFFSSFCNEHECIKQFTNMSELNKDPLFNTAYCFVTGDDYTHAVLLNTPMPELKIPKERVIGLALEPNPYLKFTVDFFEYAKKNIGIYLIGEKTVFLTDNFKEHFGYLWHTTPPETQPIKKNIISLMISDKTVTDGNKYRHRLCSKILSTKLPIDIYGRGCKFYSFTKDPRLKGNFEDKEPYLDYKFHIAIENYITPHYLSEKVINPLLCGTVPVYLGCKNIDCYFLDKVINLTGDIDKDMQILENICSDPEKYKKQINVEEIKKTVSFTSLLKKISWIA